MLKEGARSKRHIAFCVVLLAYERHRNARNARPNISPILPEAPELDAAPERLTTQAG